MSERYYSHLVEENYTCPVCKSQDIALDNPKGEIYCQKCGLVIASPSGDGILPYDYGVQKNIASKGQQTDITNYRHSYTNKQLMRYGRK